MLKREFIKNGNIVFHKETVYDKCRTQQHPVKEVELVNKIITEATYNGVYYSNSFDFISAIKHIGLKHKVQTEFFLNGVSCGNDIELIFKDFNRALDMINELGQTEE